MLLYSLIENITLFVTIIINLNTVITTYKSMVYNILEHKIIIFIVF